MLIWYKSDDYMVHFFRKIAYKKGRGAAITASARKIAIILWNMIVKQMPYTPQKPEQYLNQIKNRKMKNLQKNIQKLNITIDELAMLFQTS